jgi:hypothetical protein
VFYDPGGGVYRSRGEIDRVAGAIRATHPDFRYQPIAEPEELGNGGRVQWVSGRPGEAPAYAGTDFIIARDGRIAAFISFSTSYPDRGPTNFRQKHPHPRFSPGPHVARRGLFTLKPGARLFDPHSCFPGKRTQTRSPEKIDRDHPRMAGLFSRPNDCSRNAADGVLCGAQGAAVLRASGLPAVTQVCGYRSG